VLFLCRIKVLQGNFHHFSQTKISESSLGPFLTPKKMKRLPSVSFALVKIESKDGPLIALF